MYELLDRINTPADLKTLNPQDLVQLCAEIRAYMLECCSRNPGHLASSLGCVELTVALHYVFDTPSDKLVFDVGHQAYAHKILTGRKKAFENIRTEGGLSGFPKMSESEYDAFGVGHSSTSVSAALGYAEAAKIRGEKCKAIAVIGDGALTGGLAFEGLNNAGASKADLLVILNDNNHSIDSNTGGLHNHLLKITTSHSYNAVKSRVWDMLGERKVRNIVQRFWRSLKSGITRATESDFFEDLGLRYFGPMDGHDVVSLVKVLQKIRDMKGPRVLHCITTKGKGYAPAEQDPTVWHAPGKFNPATGERIISKKYSDRYQDVFGWTLCELARENESIVGITPAMASGCGMTPFADEFPKRFFDVGIEEEHAVTFSAGLAAGGLTPFCNIYSAFSQRAYDQIIHDVALQNLPVIFCFDRAGLVGEDGATHHGAFDIAAYRSIPGIVIAAPANETELRGLMHTAAAWKQGPFIIRYPRGEGEGVNWKDGNPTIYNIGKAEKMVDGSEVAIVATGPAVGRAVEAALESEGRAAVWNFRFVKPADLEVLEHIRKNYRRIITIEDGCIKGGLHSEVCEYMTLKGFSGTIKALGIADEFVRHGRQSSQRAACGLDKQSIAELINELCKKDL